MGLIQDSIVCGWTGNCLIMDWDRDMHTEHKQVFYKAINSVCDGKARNEIEFVRTRPFVFWVFSGFRPEIENLVCPVNVYKLDHQTYCFV